MWFGIDFTAWPIQTYSSAALKTHSVDAKNIPNAAGGGWTITMHLASLKYDSFLLPPSQDRLFIQSPPRGTPPFNLPSTSYIVLRPSRLNSQLLCAAWFLITSLFLTIELFLRPRTSASVLVLGNALQNYSIISRVHTRRDYDARVEQRRAEETLQADSHAQQTASTPQCTLRTVGDWTSYCKYPKGSGDGDASFSPVTRVTTGCGE